MLKLSASVACILGLCTIAGCASTEPPPPSGFLSDYSALQVSGDGSHRYSSPDLKNYKAFIIDPVQIRVQRESSKIGPADQAQVAQHFTESLSGALTRRGYRVVSAPGVGVARFRIALTDVQASKWWRNHHAGEIDKSGTGGASMEGEVIDSVTGRQLAAVIQKGQANQYELSEFSSLDDVKATIDQWTRAAATRLDELHQRR